MDSGLVLGEEGDGFGGRVGGAGEGADDEVDDGVGKDGDDEADDGVEDGVLGVGDLFAVAAGEDIAEAADEKHDDGDAGDDVEGDVRDVADDARVTEEGARHFVGFHEVGAFLERPGGDVQRDEREAEPEGD